MYSNDEIISIEQINCDSLRYDIEVEANHNFFANDLLVHNCQNLTEELAEWKTQVLTWEVTEKLDGSSMTVFLKDDYFGVCSRNWELKETAGNTFWRVARLQDIEGRLRKFKSNLGKNIAVQGELIGEGIQGNPYGITGHDFRVYDIFDIDAQEYFSPVTRRDICAELGLTHVPVYQYNMGIDATVEELLDMAEMKSSLNLKAEQEGVVFKCNENNELSFKCISNRFLLKHGN